MHNLDNLAYQSAHVKKINGFYFRFYGHQSKGGGDLQANCLNLPDGCHIIIVMINRKQVHG